MRKHWKNFTLMFFLSWLGGATTISLYLYQYAAEDFSIADLIPFCVILMVFGIALSTLSFAVLSCLSKKLRGFITVPVLAFVSIVLMTFPVAVYTGFRAFVFQNLPVVEFVLLTGAFLLLSLTFGFAFLRFYGDQMVRGWLPTLFYAGLIIGSILIMPVMITSASEALLSDRANGWTADFLEMSVPRSAHTATLLKDGRVLLTGGMISVTGQELPTSSSEIFDPRTNKIEPIGKMLIPRAGHTATLLDTGDVLITGGIDEKQPIASAELYRVATGDFVIVGSMRLARERHSASKLVDGTVLITGGTVNQPSEQAEIYDPTVKNFQPVSPMNNRRAAQTSTLLPDGRVLIAGGAESQTSIHQSLEIYDPKDKSFKSAGMMQVSRFKHSAILLKDGKVLLLGGSDEREWTGRRNSVEIYDPVTNASRIIGAMNRGRFKISNAAVLSKEGMVIVAGSGRKVEIFNPQNNNFLVSAGSLQDEWFYATATLLHDNRVFIAGGYNSSLIPTPQIWLYEP